MTPWFIPGVLHTLSSLVFVLDISYFYLYFLRNNTLYLKLAIGQCHVIW